MNDAEVAEVSGEPQSELLPVTVSTEPSDFLSPLLETPQQQQKASRERGRSFDTCSVAKSDISEFEEKGWQIQSKSKRKAILRKAKPHHKMLEDRVWMLLYRMGYDKINGQRFTISFSRRNGSTGRKQIDVFACDSETAFVIECKSKETRGKRSLQKDIQETISLQDYIRKSVYSRYKEGLRPKIIWAYATNNILWTESDIERATDGNIVILTENEIQYYETFIRYMGPAGRYQILSEFLKGQKIPGIGEIKIPAVKGKIGGETFYSFVTRPKDLLRISFVNHQALNNPEENPAYQRMISANRIKQIGRFISSGGFFPTNLIVNFVHSPKFDPISNKENVDPDIKFGWLTLPNVYRSAWIIDGQHRLYGYSHLGEQEQKQSIFVLGFDGMATHKEANMFITINHEQKSVPKSLLVTLLADLKLGSDDPRTAINALASAIVRKLNTDRTSPFFRRFVLPGVPADESQNLTVSEAVNGLVRSGLLGKVVHGNRVPGPLSGPTDEATIERSRQILNGYFHKLRDASSQRWDGGKQRFVSTNPSVRAHLSLIGEIVRHLAHHRHVDFVELDEGVFVEYVTEYAGAVFAFFSAATDERVEQDYSRKFGEGGVKEYLFNLCSILSEDKPDFGSEEFRRFMAAKGSSKVEEANQLVIDMTEKMTNKVIAMLKSVHGEQVLDSGEAAYWERGIPIRRVRDNAYRKQQEDKADHRLRKEAYLDVVDLKEIVEDRTNWSFFADIFSNPMPGESGGGNKKNLGWMDRFNEVRRIPAHKNMLRTYSESDYELLEWIRGTVLQKMD